MKIFTSDEMLTEPAEGMTRRERRAWYHANRKALRLPPWGRLAELAPPADVAPAAADDPAFAYVDRVLGDVREAQAGGLRAAALTLAAMAGIPAAAGLIYWYL